MTRAVTHRDYTSSGSVQVMLFADRLGVWNPGALPPSLTLERLRHPHASFPANPLLAEPLYLTKYIERMGTGTGDMIRRCRETGLAEPQFRLDGGCFVLTIRRKTAQVTAQIGEQVTAQVTGQLEEQDKVLATSVLDEIAAAFSLATGQVTGQVAGQVIAACQVPQSGGEIQRLVGIKHRETFLNNYLKPLLASGWIERTIPDKPTSRLQKYQLTEKGRTWLKKARP